MVNKLSEKIEMLESIVQKVPTVETLNNNIY